MKINVAWSGGFDSTHMVIKLLEKGYKIKPYYFKYKDRIEQSILSVNKEINAVKEISKILKKTYKNNLENIEFIDYSNIADQNQNQIITRYMKNVGTISIGIYNEDICDNVRLILSHINNIDDQTSIPLPSPATNGMFLGTLFIKNLPTQLNFINIKTIDCMLNRNYCVKPFLGDQFNKVFRLPTIHYSKHLALLEMYENYNDIFSLCVCCRRSVNGQPCNNCGGCLEWDQYKLEKSLTLERARKLKNYLKENNISPDIIHEIPINKSLKLPEHITEPLDSYIDGRGNVKELRKKLNLGYSK